MTRKLITFEPDTGRYRLVLRAASGCTYDLTVIAAEFERLRAELSAAPAPADTQRAEPWRPADDYGRCVSDEQYEPGDDIRTVPGGVECRGCVEAWGSDGTAPPTHPASTESAQTAPAGTSGHPEGVAGDSGVPAKRCRAVREVPRTGPVQCAQDDGHDGRHAGVGYGAAMHLWDGPAPAAGTEEGR